MEETYQTPTEALGAKLSHTNSTILDYSVSSGKPIFSVTVKGAKVEPDVFEACRKFGYTHVESVRQSIFTQDVGKATTIMFFM